MPTERDFAREYARRQENEYRLVFCVDRQKWAALPANEQQELKREIANLIKERLK